MFHEIISTKTYTIHLERLWCR